MSGTGNVTAGMQVYGADGQLLGVVDDVQYGGFLVAGQFIAGSAVGRASGNRVELTDSGAGFKPQGAERGDRAEEELGPMADADVAPVVGDDSDADTRLAADPN